MKTELEKRDEAAGDGANEENEGRGGAQDDNAAAAGEDQPIEDLEAKRLREEENQKLAEMVKEGQKMASEEFDYKLVGVVIHMGIADAGHYISYINIERDGDASDGRQQWLETDKQTWLEFNDSVVTPFDFSQM